MSTLSAKEIELQLSLYDVHVRRAVESGTIHEYMAGHSAAIKSFYKSCKNVKGEALAAFDAPRFVHRFLRDWRNNNDSEEFFLRRQQGKLKEFDGIERPPLSLPPTPDVRRRTSQPALAGPGPVTAAARAAINFAARDHAAGDRTVHFADRAASPPRLSFRTMDQDSDVEMGEEGKRDLDSDVEIVGKGKMKAKEKVTVPPVRERIDDVQEVPPPLPKKSKKKAPKVQTEDEDGDSERENTVIVYRPKPKPRPQPIPTGDYHDPACEQCHKLRRPCEKEQAGRACVSCKRNKHKCDYSLRNVARQVKSKPVVEESEDDAAGSSAATTLRHTRPAAKRAKQAIQDAAAAPKPSRRTRKKTTPPGINLAADTDDERMSAMEKRLKQAHNKLDGAIMGLEKASRLERCERKLDRLTLLLEAVCERVGVTVSLFGEEEPAVNPAVNPAASTSGQQEPAASTSAQQEPAALTSMSATTSIPPPTLTLIPPTPHQSQDAEMQGPSSLPESTPDPPASQEPTPLQDVPHSDLPPHDVGMQAAQEVTEDPAEVSAKSAASEVTPDSAASEVTVQAADSMTPDTGVVPPVALVVPPIPKPPSRQKTPVPTGSDTLQLPQRSTRSRSRSRSPSPLTETSGSKRKAEEASAEGESAPKKART